MSRNLLTYNDNSYTLCCNSANAQHIYGFSKYLHEWVIFTTCSILKINDRQKIIDIMINVFNDDDEITESYETYFDGILDQRLPLSLEIPTFSPDVLKHYIDWLNIVQLITETEMELLIHLLDDSNYEKMVEYNSIVLLLYLD